MPKQAAPEHRQRGTEKPKCTAEHRRISNLSKFYLQSLQGIQIQGNTCLIPPPPFYCTEFVCKFQPPGRSEMTCTHLW